MFCVTREGEVRQFLAGTWVERLAQIANDVREADKRALREEARRRALAAGSKRCSFYGAIRGFYSAAQRRALDTKADEAIRAAMSEYFEKPIETRKSLSGSQWLEAAGAVEIGALTWA